jgi:putative transposase
MTFRRGSRSMRLNGTTSPQASPSSIGFAESFIGRFRDECLNEPLFNSLRQAPQIIEGWRIDYNTGRPHTSLTGLTPNEFASWSKMDQNQNRFSYG